jgi:hypothetical protein
VLRHGSSGRRANAASRDPHGLLGDKPSPPTPEGKGAVPGATADNQA